MRTRLWPPHPPEYTGTRDNFAAANHKVRALETGAIIASLGIGTVIDPACGDNTVLEAAYQLNPFLHAVLGDISKEQIAVIQPTFPHEKHARDAFEVLTDAPHSDLVVLSEFLEHLMDPDAMLMLARRKANWLVASSPIGDPEGGRNHEHLWAWDQEGYGEMLVLAGWEPLMTSAQTFPGTPWSSQIWLAR